MDIPQLAYIEVLLYADDITIRNCGPTKHDAKFLMQIYLNEFHSYCTHVGLNVNTQKTVFQYFTAKRVNVPVLQYQPIAYKHQHKLLGVMLDILQLKWVLHLTSPPVDVMRCMDLLKHMASPTGVQVPGSYAYSTVPTLEPRWTMVVFCMEKLHLPS
jgi:hypothetical protein